MWLNNQVSPHGIPQVTQYGKQFHDGKVYAALIHNNRPKFISVSDMDGNNEANIQKVLDAATRYFDFDQYLTPAEVVKLDTKSSFIFASEFYYGIAKMRRVDLACRRTTKLVTYTKINDALRAEYKGKADIIVERLANVNGRLGDRTIDNTMAGARAKLADFNSYKEKDKPVIISTFLSCESVYNHLAMRLSDHARPVYNPGTGLGVPELRKAIADLEALESERQVELTQEVNRQIRLAQEFAQHGSRAAKLVSWTTEKDAYLATKETCTTSGEALYHINTLVAYNEESATMQSTVVQEMTALGAGLEKESFENIATVKDRESKNTAAFEKLAAAAATKKAILDDDLARLKKKEAIDLVNLKHVAKYNTLKDWNTEKAAYLATKESISTVAEAQLQISILEMYVGDQKDIEANSVAALKAVGQEILTAEYQSDLSSWKFENPGEVTGREAEVDGWLQSLTKAAADKSAVLQDDLARELEKERLRLLFANQASEFTRWSASLVADLPGTAFGFNLAQVSAFKAKLDAQDGEISSSANAKLSAAKDTFSAAEKLGVTENAYTTFSPAALDDSNASLKAAQAARVSAYEAELARVTEDDRISREFADIANPLNTNIESTKTAITTSTASLEDQIAGVQAAQATDNSGKIASCEDLHKQLEARNVEYNVHSNLTANDVKVLVEQFNFFLEKKLTQLQDEKEHKELRGLTKEQYAEIESQFKEFDKSGDGILNKTEFKSCLFSLGEERTGKEITETMAKYGDADKMTYAGFKEFMISQLGDTDTKEEILAGWKLINKDKDVAVVALMTETILRDEDVEYIKETAPAVGSDYDYTAWTEDVFSR
jgi:Ca2+-binding EF-hand superfamily protein